jgi:septal ring factor EnvC (AmiA/AmiB activator)
MATARRRAAARWVLSRDRKEEALLADEAALLATAATRLTADRAAATTVALPPAGIARPVRGTIVRGFGPFEHERSHTTLSRRGLDFEVADQAPVHAVADGTVLYAGPIRGLDAGLILDHGGWLSVLGKLDGLTVVRGDRVTRDQELGRAAGRRVYLEVRVAVSPGGVPVDPAPLFE